ncbi:MAG: hypothetical protein AMXMBFR84_33390 [Candidatus Hydrogenedentota bacterium]
MKETSHPAKGTPPGQGESCAQPAWREQFPIDVPDDEYRSRRDFTKLVGLTSLAFVAGQGYIVVESERQKVRGRLPELEIAGANELAVGSSKLFHYPDKGDACVLVRVSEDRHLAYGQKCTHLSCPVIPAPSEGKFLCPCHHGYFDLFTGEPLAGPPRRALPAIELSFRDEKIFAVGIKERSA